MPWVTPTNFAAGVVVTEAMLDNLSDNLTAGVTRPLAEVILAAPAATVDFSSIPATFRNLRVTINARGSAASSTIDTFLRFNNSTNVSEYHSQGMFVVGSTQNAVEYAGSFSGILIGVIPGTSATQANEFGGYAATVFDYLNTTSLKTAIAIGSERYGGSAAGFQRTYIIGGTWDSTAAVNRLTLFPGSGNFAAGSKFTLYGEPFI